MNSCGAADFADACLIHKFSLQYTFLPFSFNVAAVRLLQLICKKNRGRPVVKNKSAIITTSKLIVCTAPYRGHYRHSPLLGAPNYSIASHALLPPVNGLRVRLISFISPSHSTVYSQVFAFLRKASCESFFSFSR